MDYNCERCGYCTDMLYNLKQHLKRKKECSPKLSDIPIATLHEELFGTQIVTISKKYECEHCENVYASYDSRRHHIKKCKKRMTPEEQRIKILEQQKQIDELKSAVTIQNQTNIQNAKTINNVQNITINAFGKEDTKYLIESPDYKKFMIDCLKNNMQGLLQLTDYIYYHKEHPENHNVKKPNKKDNFLKAYNGNKWNTIFAKDGINAMLNRINKEFMLFLESMEDNNERVHDPIMKRFMTKVGHALDFDFSIFNYDYECDNNEEELKKMRREISALYLYYINEKTNEQLGLNVEL